MSAVPRRRIVVGIDGLDSPYHGVLTAALDHATEGGELRIVRALAVSLPEVDAPPAAGRRTVADRPSSIRVATAELRRHIAAYLEEQRRPLPAVRYEVRFGDPATVLLMAAQQADLIVVGTRDPRRTDRRAPFLLGSVSQDVALYATCPILLIPPAC